MRNKKTCRHEFQVSGNLKSCFHQIERVGKQTLDYVHTPRHGSENDGSTGSHRRLCQRQATDPRWNPDSDCDQCHLTRFWCGHDDVYCNLRGKEHDVTSQGCDCAGRQQTQQRIQRFQTHTLSAGSIQVNIYRDNGEKVAFEGGKVITTLHLRRPQ